MQTLSVNPPRSNLAGALQTLTTVRTLLDKLQPVALLLARLYVAQVFFFSGLTKIRDWGTTVALFTDEYHVPLLSPPFAAGMAIVGELGLPVLLAFGLGGRFAAAGLFVMNIVAVIAFTDISPAGVQQHYLWGVMLAALVLWGPGKLSVDHVWLGRLGLL